SIENANAAAGTLTVTSTSNTEFAGVIADGTGGGKLNLVKTGSGTLTISGGNTYTGTLQILQGTLQVGNGGAPGVFDRAGGGAVTNNTDIVFNTTATISALNPISGTGNITKQATGTVTLGNANSYSGRTTITGGNLTIGTSASLGDASATNDLAISAATL